MGNEYIMDTEEVDWESYVDLMTVHDLYLEARNALWEGEPVPLYVQAFIEEAGYILK